MALLPVADKPCFEDQYFIPLYDLIKDNLYTKTFIQFACFKQSIWDSYWTETENHIFLQKPNQKCNFLEVSFQLKMVRI